jgi:hypothetical protein
MTKTSQALACWFIRDGAKLVQCSKEDFDKAIIEGKSVKYRGYANKKSERIADQLEESRMGFLNNSDLPPKFRAAITTPKHVVEVEIILADDPQFWLRESKRPKYLDTTTKCKKPTNQ